MSGSLSWPKDEKDAAVSRPDQPMQVRIAVILMYVGAAVAAVQPIWWLMMPRTGKEDFAEKALKRGKQAITPDAIGTHLDQLTILILVTGLVTIALWIATGMLNNKGKRWARMSATFLAMANLVYTFTAQPSLHGMALVLIGVVAAGLLWMSGSRAWFNGGAAPSGRPLKV